MALDTLEIAKDLRAAGFTEDQAEAVTRAVRKSHDVDLSNLATKADLENHRQATKADLDSHRHATKADLENLRQATKADLENLKQATKADLLELKNDLVRWMIGIMLANTFGILGITLAAIRFLR